MDVAYNPNKDYPGGYPPQGGYPQSGYPQGGYPPQPGMYGGYPPQSAGYPPQTGGGYPPQAGGGYPPQPGGFQPSGGYSQYGGGAGAYPQGDYTSQPAQGHSGGEDPSVKGYQFDDVSIRRGFIRKVYAILGVQLSVSLGFISLCTFHGGTKKLVGEHRELFWVSVILLFGTMIAMACCESVRRTSPMNFIMLGIFTVAQSFMLGMMTIRVPSETVMLAVGATAVVCLALTLFAFQTKWDFTLCNGILFVALIIFMVFGLVAMFFPGRTMHLIYASCGALLFSIYLIYDTQLMMGGDHKLSISPEEYIFAALNIYMDIVNIFIYILAILSASRD